MKAAWNGVSQPSILDGWWLEGLAEGVSGWAIGSESHLEETGRSPDAAGLYEELERMIVAMFYHDRERFIEIMRHAIAVNGSHFNSQRRLQQYISNAFLG